MKTLSTDTNIHHAQQIKLYRADYQSLEGNDIYKLEIMGEVGGDSIEITIFTEENATIEFTA